MIDPKTAVELNKFSKDEEAKDASPSDHSAITKDDHTLAIKSDSPSVQLSSEVITQNVFILLMVLVPLLALYFLYIPWRNGNSYYNKCFSIATWEVTFLPIATVVAYMVSYFISAVCPESYGGLGKSNAWKSLSFELISQISNTSLQDMFRFCIAMFGVGIYLHCVNGMQLYSPSFNLKGPSEGSFYLFYSGGANATLWISKACEFGGACDWVEQRDCGCFSSVLATPQSCLEPMAIIRVYPRKHAVFGQTCSTSIGTSCRSTKSRHGCYAPCTWLISSSA